MSDTASPDFEAIRKFNSYGVEWWSARDLMKALGYKRWENFQVAIRRAIQTCEQENQVATDHFRDITQKVTLGSGAIRNVKDYALDRWACYLIAINGDTAKQEIADAQTYFLTKARVVEIQELRAKQAQRLRLRERISDGNKDLADAAQKAGVQSKNFGTFQNAGYEGLYGGLDLAAIKEQKGIPANEDLLDRAGLLELGANALRIGLTEQRLRTGGIVGENPAINAHRRVGEAIRNAIADEGGPMPEELPIEPSIKPLLSDAKRKRKKAESSGDLPPEGLF